MSTKCRACPLRRTGAFKPFSASDEAFMERFKVGEMAIEPGRPILMEGTAAPQLFTALRGMGLRYKMLPDGRRQVLNFVFPGDFLGLQAGVLREMKHSVESATRMTLCVFDRNEFWSFFRNHPERGFDMTWLTAVEESLLGATLATVGQRDARERVSWALTTLFQRGRQLGLVENDAMPFPFRQQDLADALGLSLVHTNKTLARLRSMQLATWHDGTLRVLDEQQLSDLACMDIDPPAERPLM